MGKKLLAIVALMMIVLTGVWASGAKDSASSNELVIYSPNSDTEIAAVIPAFEKATGIKVILQSMGTGDVLARLEAEKANPQADVNWGAVNVGFWTDHQDLYEYYISPNDAALPEAYQSYNGYFTYTKLSGSAALLVNEDVFAEIGLDPDEFTGYKDLLRPELKGRIAMGDPTASSSAWAELTNMLLVMGDEPYDEKAWDEHIEEYMFGPDILVAPVLYEGKRTRSVYLPAGADWIDYWTGENHAGGTAIEVDAPIERIPFFFRSGRKVF